MPRKLDIVLRLKATAVQVDDRPVEEIESLLNEAAEAIELLRELVGIREEPELEAAEPAGRA